MPGVEGNIHTRVKASLLDLADQNAWEGCPLPGAHRRAGRLL